MMATDTALKKMAADENLTVAIERQRHRLRNFVRTWVPDESTVEDILQDVFYEFIQAYRLIEIEQVGAWLFRVAKNRITDIFRKRKFARFDELNPDNLPSSRTAGPEDAYLQSCSGTHSIPLWPSCLKNNVTYSSRMSSKAAVSKTLQQKPA